jgi:hypothetical protein
MLSKDAVRLLRLLYSPTALLAAAGLRCSRRVAGHCATAEGTSWCAGRRAANWCYAGSPGALWPRACCTSWCASARACLEALGAGPAGTLCGCSERCTWARRTHTYSSHLDSCVRRSCVLWVLQTLRCASVHALYRHSRRSRETGPRGARCIINRARGRRLAAERLRRKQAAGARRARFAAQVRRAGPQLRRCLCAAPGAALVAAPPVASHPRPSTRSASSSFGDLPARPSCPSHSDSGRRRGLARWWAALTCSSRLSAGLRTCACRSR